MKNYAANGLVLPKWNIIYFAIPKVASSSFKALFGKYHGIGGRQPHYFWAGKGVWIPSHRLEAYNGMKAFTIVRHPASRLYSCFGEKLDASGYDGAAMKKGVNKNVFGSYGGFHAGMDFSEFVRRIIKIPHAQADRHFSLQAEHLADHRGNVPKRIKIFKYEKMNELLEYLQGMGIDTNLLPHRNRTRRKGGNWETDTDAETYELIKEYYKRDFQLFDYV